MLLIFNNIDSEITHSSQMKTIKSLESARISIYYEEVKLKSIVPSIDFYVVIPFLPYKMFFFGF